MSLLKSETHQQICIKLYAFFWVIPQRLNIICRRFGTHCSIFIPTCLWRWNRQCVTKRRQIKFRCQGITQKSAYNIQNMAKVWNQALLKIVLQLDHILLNTLHTSVVTDSNLKHEGRRGKRHRKVYTYIVLLYGKWSLCHYFYIYGLISLCQFLPYIQKKHGFVGGFISTDLNHCCENYV